MDDFHDRAQKLALEMHRGNWKLPMLDEFALDCLAERLFNLSPEGFAEHTFQQMFKHPTTEQVQRKSDRLWKGLDAISSAAVDNGSASQEAKALLLRDVYYNEGTSAANAVHNLLIEAERLRQVLPSDAPRVEVDPDRDALTTRRGYKTYAIGFVIPNLFRTLYPSVKFGTQKIDKETYEGPGVDFTLACCEEIGFGKMNVNTIRKNIDRAKDFGLIPWDTLV